MPVDDAGANPLHTSRRTVLTAALAGGGATGLGLVAGSAAASGRPALDASTSVRRALGFLGAAADAYPTSNPGVRLAQSYADELGLFSTAFVYDNALAVCAHLSADKIARARQLGDGLLYAMEHDPEYSDGRLRQAYNVGPYTFYDGSPQPYGFVLPDGGANIGYQFGFLGTAVGDMAWPGIALAQLYTATGGERYLRGALRIAEWIVDNAYSELPLGGYQFGVNGANEKVAAWSTEHNIDVLGFFGLLRRATGERRWRELAEHAAGFVDKMSHPDGAWFWTGSNDGTTINTDPVPLDPQTWGWLVLRDERASAAIDWADRELRTTDSADQPTSQLPDGFAVEGVTFSTDSLTSTAQYNGVQVHPQGVWLEGTGQLVSAWRDRRGTGDHRRAEHQLVEMRAVQATLGQGQHMGGEVLPASSGLVAASSLIDSGFGFGYFQVQHVGATSWYVMGALGTNPYQRRGLR